MPNIYIVNSLANVYFARDSSGRESFSKTERKKERKKEKKSNPFAYPLYLEYGAFLPEPSLGHSRVVFSY
jgi:hypothetical protein